MAKTDRNLQCTKGGKGIVIKEEDFWNGTVIKEVLSSCRQLRLSVEVRSEPSVQN